VSTTLTTLLIESIAAHANLLDSHVALHAAFVSALYRIVGIEFGARASSCGPAPRCTDVCFGAT
jgi:hypothetical protein